MKYLFVIQGEGRGHFTQALSLKTMLEKNGHEVVAVLVGCSSHRSLPGFFTRKLGLNPISFLSPNFLPGPKAKKSILLVSILYNLILIPSFISSILQIRKTIRETQPDVVINFYELLCGLMYGIMPPAAPMINIAHQYYLNTTEFKYTGTDRYQFNLLRFYTWLTSLNSTRILALSFRKASAGYRGKACIVPPLLRKEVLNTQSTQGNYIHGYMLNNGFASELSKWSEHNPEQELHFFWDKKGAEKETRLTSKLTMHSLDDELFLSYMAGCKAYATTAGFESVCEAMYLSKPVMMIPTHIEQECNAMDASRSEAGFLSENFELDPLLQYQARYQPAQDFRYWVHASEDMILYQITHFGSAPTSLVMSI